MSNEEVMKVESPGESVELQRIVLPDGKVVTMSMNGDKIGITVGVEYTVEQLEEISPKGWGDGAARVAAELGKVPIPFGNLIEFIKRGASSDK